MMMNSRASYVLLMMLASACDGGNGTPTSPSSAPSATPMPPPAASPSPSREWRSIALHGQITDSTTSAPISGAIVSINGRSETTTNSSGNYNLTGLLDAGDNVDYNHTWVSADNYADDYRYIRSTSHNVRLHRIVRITAGDSTRVTVAPNDTVCVNNARDMPNLGIDYVCRSVRVVAPSAGIMTLEALSTTNGPPPLLVVENFHDGQCCPARIENPSSIPVTAGREVLVFVEMPSGSATSQSFTLITSMKPR